jgi:hypothetical protein
MQRRALPAQHQPLPATQQHRLATEKVRNYLRRMPRDRVRARASRDWHAPCNVEGERSGMRVRGLAGGAQATLTQEYMAVKRQFKLALPALLVLAATGCAAEVADLEGDLELQEERQAYVNSINGLRAVNGLRTINGLRVANGLRTVNGLRVVNGLSTNNGLRTVNGLRVVNGLRTVNGYSTVNGYPVNAPDGLLSKSTGMMASNDGIVTAKYLVRCALPAGKSIAIKDYTGATVSLAGELGLAPTWETGTCDKACQERITACLMAFSNGTGNNVSVSMSAHDTVLKTSHPSGWKQEAAFYGNIFFGSDEPEKGGAFYCMGDATYDANSGWFQSGYVPRFCQGYANQDDCPFQKSYEACDYSFTRDACTESYGAMKYCKDNSGRAWSYAITTYLPDIRTY